MRVRTVLVLALFVLAPMAFSADGAAQAGETEGIYVLEDSQGDVRPVGLGTGVGPDAPPNAATDPYDIVAFRIVEDTPGDLVMQIELANWNSPANLQEGPITFGGMSYWVNFQLAGSQITYEIVPSGYGRYCGPTSCEYVLFSDLCIRSENNTGCYYQSIDTAFDTANSQITFTVSKRALLGLEESQRFGGSAERPSQLPKHLSAGTVLEGWYAEFSSTFLADRVPDAGTGAPYQLKTTSANTKIGVFLDEDDEAQGNDIYYYGPSYTTTTTDDAVAVSPGVPTIVPLRVDNNAQAKRLINLTVELPDATAGKWEAQIAPAVQIPAGESRVVNLIINASEQVNHRDNTTVWVHGKALGHDEEIGFLRILAQGSVPPSPDHPTLYFHASRPQNDDPDALAALYTATQMWTNTLADDPRGTLDGDGYATQFNIVFTGTQWYGNFAMDTELVRSVLFDPKQPITGSVYFSSQVAYEGEVTLGVYSEDAYLGGSSVFQEVGTEPTEFPFTFFVNPDEARVTPDEGPLRLQLTMTADGFVAPALADSVKFHAGESQVTLPLIPDPDAGNVNVSLGPARIGLSLADDTEREEFVNPNRTKLFELVLVNEGIESDTAKLNLTYDEDAGWQATVKPSMKYALSPGESATIGLLVTAPPNATEGQQFDVGIEAVSQKNPDVTSRTAVTAIATQGVDIPDESDAYQADEDTLANSVPDDEGGDSPGVGLFAAALAATAGLVMARRRKEKR